jgi:hypothetical protein
MDVVSAKVLGTGAFVFGLIFITTSAVRLSRADLDIVLVLLNSALGILLLFAERSTTGSRSPSGRRSGGSTGNLSIMTTREWLGRRLPLWTLVLAHGLPSGSEAKGPTRQRSRSLTW